VLSAAGHEVILRDMTAGEAFGELAAIDQQPRSASIFAQEDCVLIRIPGPVFARSVYQDPTLAEWLSRRLAARIRDLTIRVFELNSLRVPARLHCELLRLCGPVAVGEVTTALDPSPTHAELASRIGTHREAVTREMGFLVRNGVVQQVRRRITVLDVPALVRLVHLAAGEVGAEDTPSSIVEASLAAS
jgi:CRP/FNR family cyclic AMP-dependent transcriptional regulator